MFQLTAFQQIITTMHTNIILGQRHGIVLNLWLKLGCYKAWVVKVKYMGNPRQSKVGYFLFFTAD